MLKLEKRLSVVLVPLTLGLLTGVAECLPSLFSELPTLDDFMLEITRPPLTVMPLDQHLIETAKATGINVLADATDFPDAALSRPYPATGAAQTGLQNPKFADQWRPTRFNVVDDLARQNRLTHLRFEKSTFLFWSEPDLPKLAYMISAEERRRNFEDNSPVVSTEEANSLLFNYLRDIHAWDGTPPQQTIRIKMSDLPLPVQQKAWATLQESFKILPREHIFSDDFWKEARLSVHYTPGENEGAGFQPSLVLHIKRKSVRSFFPVGRLDRVLPARTRRTKNN